MSKSALIPSTQPQRRFIYHYTCISKTAACLPSPLRGGIISTAFAVVDPKAYETIRKMVADAPGGGELISLNFLHAVEQAPLAPEEIG